MKECDLLLRWMNVDINVPLGKFDILLRFSKRRRGDEEHIVNNNNEHGSRGQTTMLPIDVVDANSW